MLISKMMAEIIENHSEFSGCPNSCNRFVSSRSWQTMKLPMILLWKGTSAPVAHLVERAEGPMPPPSPIDTGFGGLNSPQTILQAPQIEIWNITNQWSFGKFRNDKPLVKTFWRSSAPAMLPFSDVLVHYTLHALPLLVVLLCVTEMNINYQRSPKTKQFITAKNPAMR